MRRPTGRGPRCSRRSSIASAPTELRARLGRDDRRPRPDRADACPAEAPDARLAPDTARFRLYDAVVRLCRLSTVDAPLVAVLDDVHVADPSSLSALAVPRRPARCDGVCSSSRPIAMPTRCGDGFADVLAQLVRERNTTRLRLGGLDADGVAEVIGGGDRHRAIATAGREGPRADRRQSRCMSVRPRGCSQPKDGSTTPSTPIACSSRATCVRPCSGGSGQLSEPVPARASSSHRCSAATSLSTSSKRSRATTSMSRQPSTKPRRSPSSSTARTERVTFASRMP